MVYMNNTPSIIGLENYPDMLTTKHLAEIFGVSKNTIYKEIQTGKFGTPERIGRQLMIPKLYIWNRFIAGYNQHYVQPYGEPQNEVVPI